MGYQLLGFYNTKHKYTDATYAERGPIMNSAKTNNLPFGIADGNGRDITSKTLKQAASSDIESVLREYDTSLTGLHASKAHRLIEKYGLNEVGQEKRQHWLVKLIKTFKDPLIIMLLVLAAISFLTKDYEAMIVILVMVLVSVSLRFFSGIQG